MSAPEQPDDPRDEEQEGGLFEVPGFATGGRVERTGIALVHQGEYVLPASGSEAIMTADAGEDLAGQVINYYFPVEVEIIGELGEAHMKRLAAHVFDELLRELDSRG